MKFCPPKYYVLFTAQEFGLFHFCSTLLWGGGWTLVASISSSNNNHLLRTEVNCLLPNRCVENVSSDIPTRKMSDKDIHAIATTEGKINEQKQGALQFYETKIFASICSFLLFFLISMVKLFFFINSLLPGTFRVDQVSNGFTAFFKVKLLFFGV